MIKHVFRVNVLVHKRKIILKNIKNQSLLQEKKSLSLRIQIRENVVPIAMKINIKGRPTAIIPFSLSKVFLVYR